MSGYRSQVSCHLPWGQPGRALPADRVAALEDALEPLSDQQGCWYPPTTQAGALGSCGLKLLQFVHGWLERRVLLG
jgi:hypothetical protein